MPSRLLPKELVRKNFYMTNEHPFLTREEDWWEVFISIPNNNINKNFHIQS